MRLGYARVRRDFPRLIRLIEQASSTRLMV